MEHPSYMELFSLENSGKRRKQSTLCTYIDNRFQSMFSEKKKKLNLEYRSSGWYYWFKKNNMHSIKKSYSKVDDIQSYPR